MGSSLLLSRFLSITLKPPLYYSQASSPLLSSLLCLHFCDLGVWGVGVRLERCREDEEARERFANSPDCSLLCLRLVFGVRTFVMQHLRRASRLHWHFLNNPHEYNLVAIFGPANDRCRSSSACCGLGLWGVGFWVWGVGGWGLGVGGWGFGVGAWGLGSGVWTLGIGISVQGLGLKVPTRRPTISSAWWESEGGIQ